MTTPDPAAPRESAVAPVPPPVSHPPAPRPALTPGQVLADNFSTRIRELAAMVMFLLLAKWGLIPGTWAAGLIALVVLPIEITRQLTKPFVARAAGGGAALVLAGLVVKAHQVFTTAGPLVALAVGLAGCSGVGAAAGAALRPELAGPYKWQHATFGTCVGAGVSYAGDGLTTVHGCTRLPSFDAEAADAAIAVDAVLEGASRSPPDAGAE